MAEQRQLLASVATTFSSPPSPPRRRVHAGTTPHKTKASKSSSGNGDRDPICGAGDSSGKIKSSTSGGGPAVDKENQSLGVHNSSMAQSNSIDNDTNHDEGLPAKSPGMGAAAKAAADADADANADGDQDGSSSDRSLSMVLSPDGSQQQQPQQQELCAATSGHAHHRRINTDDATLGSACTSTSTEDSPALLGADGGAQRLMVLDDLDLSGVSSITGGSDREPNAKAAGRLSLSSAKSSGTGGTSSVLMGMNFLSPSMATTPGGLMRGGTRSNGKGSASRPSSPGGRPSLGSLSASTYDASASAITPKPSSDSTRTGTAGSSNQSASKSAATNKSSGRRKSTATGASQSRSSSLPSTPGFASPPRMGRPNFLMSPPLASTSATRTPGSGRADSVLRMMQAKSCADADGSTIVGNGGADEIGRDAADERNVEDNGATTTSTTQDEDVGIEEEKKEEEDNGDDKDDDESSFDEDMFLPNNADGSENKEEQVDGSNVADEDDEDVNSTERVVSDLAHDVPTIPEGVEDVNTSSSSEEEGFSGDGGGAKESELANSTDDHQMTPSVGNEGNDGKMPLPDDSADDDYDPNEDDTQSSPSRPSVLNNADIDPTPSRPTTAPTAAAQPAVQNVLAELPAETGAAALQRSATKTPRVVTKKSAASPSPSMATPAPGLPFGEVRVGEAPIFSPLSFHGGAMATAVASTGSVSSPSTAGESTKSSSRYFVSSTGLGAANGDNNENGTSSGMGKVRKARPSVGSLSRAGRASIGGASRRRSAAVASATDGIGILGMLGTAPACTNEPLVEQENEDDSSDGGGGSADDSIAKADGSASPVQEQGARENTVVDDESPSLEAEPKDLAASGGEDEVDEIALKGNSGSHVDDKSMAAESNIFCSPKCRRAADDDDDTLETNLDQTNDIDDKKEEEDASSSSYSDSGDDDSEDSDDETESEVSSSCSSSASADVSIVLPSRKNRQRVRGARRNIQASDEDSDASYHIGSSSDDAKDEDEKEDVLVYDDDKGDDGSYTIDSDEEDEEDDDVLIYESDESSVKAKPKRRTGAKPKARTVIVESEGESDDSDEDQDESVAAVEKSLAAISIAASQTGEENESVVEAEVVDEDQEVAGENSAPSEEAILRATDELFVAAVDKDTITVRDIFRSIEERFSMTLDKPTKKTIKSRLVALINEEAQPIIAGDMPVETPSTAGQMETTLTSVASQEGSDISSSLVGSRKNSVRRGKWTRGAQLGVGSFGVVHMGMNQRNGEMMAVKTLNLPDEEDLLADDIEREVHLMRTLEHPNIVRYLGCERDPTHSTLAIFQEWVPGGSVSSLLRKFGPFPLPVIRKYLYQICTGLAYLHDNGIIHRDIKGSNILVTDDGVCKLADFGNSRRLGSDMEDSLSMRGTPYFMAPEAFDGQCGMKSDIWSFGGVAVQMCSGLPPWKGSGVKNLHELICLLKDSDGPPSLPENTDKMLQDLIRVCFQRDPSQRPCAKDLFSHAIFAEADESSTVISGDSSFGMKSPSTKNRNSRNTCRQNGGDGESYHWPEYDKSQWPDWASNEEENEKKSVESNPYARKR